MTKIKLLLTSVIITVISVPSFSQLKFTADDGLNSSKPNSISFAGKAGSELAYEVNPNESSIKWSTANETNMSHFELQVSTDGVNFKELKKVAASDYTQWKTDYKVSFRKSYLSAEKVYYRLKAVFSDNSESFSAPVVFVVANSVSDPVYASLH